MSSRRNNLTDVPEEPSPHFPSSPYLTSSAATSSSTFTTGSNSLSATVTSPGPTKTARKPSSVRTLGRSSNDQLAASVSNSSSVKRTTSMSTSSASSTPLAGTPTTASSLTSPHNSSGAGTPTGGGSSITGSSRKGATGAATQAGQPAPVQKYRQHPRLPHDKDAEPAASTMMYWSRAPVWGAMPMRSMRAHTVTLVDSTAWLIGGSDDKDSTKDIYCFNTETMQWTHHDTVGEHPPASRAHTTTLYDRKLIVCGGGLGSTYYNTVYVLDTTNRRWYRPVIAPGPSPASRRAHSAVYYKGKVWIFGGGNGLTALNDVWTLDINGGAGTSNRPMRWEEIETYGPRPGARGYHTANLVGNSMVIIGGSDSKECFTDMWCLNLDTLEWTSIIKPGQLSYKRLAHTATQVGSYIFVMGGHTTAEYASELLLYDLVTLQYEPRPRPVHGKPPCARGYHETILADSRLFLFGGFNGHNSFDDVYILDLASGAYLPQVTSFAMGSA